MKLYISMYVTLNGVSQMNKQEIREGISAIGEYLCLVTKVGEDDKEGDCEDEAQRENIQHFYKVLDAMNEKLNEVEDVGFFKVTAVCRDDIWSCYEGSDESEKVHEALKKLDDATMERIASKLADSFCDCCYWEALKHIFESRYYDDWKAEQEEKEDGTTE